jgi:hypothetical protein
MDGWLNVWMDSVLDLLDLVIGGRKKESGHVISYSNSKTGFTLNDHLNCNNMINSAFDGILHGECILYSGSSGWL